MKILDMKLTEDQLRDLAEVLSCFCTLGRTTELHPETRRRAHSLRPILDEVERLRRMK